jgi:ComF family protein
MELLHSLKESLLHLVFPHVCEGCGTDVLQAHHHLCLSCISALPKTGFEMFSDNPVEKVFWGRVPITHATAQYYFTKESIMQRLMHNFKYRGNKELGLYLGGLMGGAIATSEWHTSIDGLVPLPLHPSKERRRGFNQATILCNGLAKELGKPVLEGSVLRSGLTETQTKMNRVDRWQNMEGRFEVRSSTKIEGRHLLLVDDVVTTGATLEACAAELLQVPGVRISIATLCYSSGT